MLTREGLQSMVDATIVRMNWCLKIKNTYFCGVTLLKFCGVGLVQLWEKFVDWIHAILLSARLLVKVNGATHEFFPCGRVVRQGDPLSPLFSAL